MGCTDGAPSWLRKFSRLLTVGLIIGRAATQGHLFRTRGVDASDGGRLSEGADGEENSESTRDEELGASAVSANGASGSAETSLDWVADESIDTHQLPTPVSAADSVTAASSGLPESSAPSTSRRVRPRRNSGDENRPSDPILRSHREEAGEVETVVTNEGSPPCSRRPQRPWWRRLWSRVRGSLSRGASAHTSFHTPIGINRYVLLFAYVVSTILSSGGVVSWPSLRSILLSQGAYASICPPSTNGTSTNAVDEYRRDSLCEAQSLRVQQLYSLASALSCIVCVVGGFLYGRIGPRAGAVLGQLFNILGWGLLALSSPSFPAHTAAIAIIGAVVALTSFPLYCVRHLFPRHQQVVVMVLGAALSASVVMPSLVVHVARFVGTSTALWGYIGVGILPSLLVAVLFVPRRDFLETGTNLRDYEYDLRRPGQRGATSEARTLIRRRLPVVHRVWRFFEANLSPHTLLSRAFISLLVYRTVVLLTIGYYFQSSSIMLSPGANGLLEYMILFSPVFCLLFGVAAFAVGLAPLMAIVSVAGLLSYVAPLMPEPAGGYISTASFSVYLGSALSQTLAILETLISEAHYPASAGILVMVSGLLGSLSAYLYAGVTVGIFASNPSYLQAACILLLALQFLWLYLVRSGARIEDHGEREQAIRAALPPAAPSQGEDSDDEGTRLR